MAFSGARMDEYLRQHKIIHDQSDIDFAGWSLKYYKHELNHLMSKENPASVLDYGCGKGLQYSKYEIHKKWRTKVRILPVLYDPCYQPFSKKPKGKYDCVICCDVLEHIPEYDLDRVLKDIFNYCALDGFVFFGVSFIKAKKILPNGKNAHATVRPADWWSEKISKNNIANSKVYCYNLSKYTEVSIREDGAEKKTVKVVPRLF
tara:strand:+ start:569 stop:1180 length:612 start_codon:yes stop_codon:yes gene_type:complete